MNIQFINFLPARGFSSFIYYLKPEGKYYGWDSVNERFYNVSTPNFSDVQEISLNNVQDAQVLTYNATTGLWENKPGAPTITELSQIDDVSTPSYINLGVLYRDTNDNLWKIATISSLLGYTPANKAGETFTGNITANNLSGTNTGDNATNSQYSGLATSKEDASNKSTTITGNETSNTLFPTIKSVVDWVTALFIKGSTNTTNFLQKTNGTGTIGNSQIFDNGNAIGIGNTNPQSRVHITNQGALVTDIGFKVRNSADTGDMLNVKGNGNVQIGIGGLSLCRADSPNGSLLATQTYRTDGTFGFSQGLISARYGGTSSTASYIESTFYNGTWQVFGQGSGTNSVFLIKTNTASTNSFFLKLQNGSTDLLNLTINGNLLLGTVTDVPSAILNLASTSKGFLPPRMTNAQRIAIASPAIGLMVYCTDATEGLYINKSTGWTFVI